MGLIGLGMILGAALCFGEARYKPSLVGIAGYVLAVFGGLLAGAA